MNFIVPEYDPFLNTESLFDQLVCLDYAEINNKCINNRGLSQICSTNPLFISLLEQKRVEHKNKLVTDKNQSALVDASRMGELAMVDELINLGFNPAACDNEAIIVASGNGYVEVVNRLMQDPRVNPADQDNKAIYLASQNGHLQVIEILLQEPRVNPADQDNRSIKKASETKELDVIQRLLQVSDVKNKLSPYYCKRLNDEINRILPDWYVAERKAYYK